MRKKWRLEGNKGQSLVEMALTFPLLLLMFVGLIEIGAALRSYLIVVNADREGARFAARGRWFDTPAEIQDIFRRTIAAAGCDGQHCDADDYVPFMRPETVNEYSPNVTIAVTYIQVPDQVDNLTMDQMEYEAPTVNGPWITGTVPSGATPIDADARAAQAQADNYAFNEKYYINEGLIDIPSEDNLVIVEIWYEHEQMLKLPILTDGPFGMVLPEKFTLYSRTEMRVTLDSRVQ